MSTLPAVTMQDLELEHTELLPRRETLGVQGGPGYGGHSSSFNAFNQVNGSHNGDGNGGNVAQGGGIGNVAIGGGNLSGNLDGDLSGNNVQIF